MGCRSVPSVCGELRAQPQGYCLEIGYSPGCGRPSSGLWESELTYSLIQDELLVRHFEQLQSQRPLLITGAFDGLGFFRLFLPLISTLLLFPGAFHSFSHALEIFVDRF